MHLTPGIETAITRATGSPFTTGARRRAGGGCINEAVVVDGVDGRRFFVKLADRSRLTLFEAEATGLETLRAAAAIRLPAPLATGVDGDRAFIVMEHLALGGRGDPALFGERLAVLHRSVSERYGFHLDNTIGTTPQPNGWMDDWIAFLGERRLGHQLAIAAAGGACRPLMDAVDALIAVLPRLFDGYRPAPSLLHGDLWRGNWGFDERGEPVIFDPAPYYGDREADVAMTELFGGPGRAFYDAYNAAWPLDDGYPLRRDLYNLYHILNHHNLFGGSYGAQAERMAKGLLAEVGNGYRG